MPPSHNDLSNEQLTRPLCKTIHTLIDHRRRQRGLLPYEWDLSLYYLALSLAKALTKHHHHPSAHPYPQKKCIGIPYKFSFTITAPGADARDIVLGLRNENWALDGFIYSVVAGYVKTRGVLCVVNVVAMGAAIPGRVCPLCDGQYHFTASQAAAVFGRLMVLPERREGNVFGGSGGVNSSDVENAERNIAGGSGGKNYMVGKSPPFADLDSAMFSPITAETGSGGAGSSSGGAGAHYTGNVSEWIPPGQVEYVNPWSSWQVPYQGGYHQYPHR